MADITPAKIIHLQPKISNKGWREVKLLNLILKTFM